MRPMRKTILLFVSCFLAACGTTDADPFSTNGPSGTGGTVATTTQPAGFDLVGTWYAEVSKAEALGAKFDGQNFRLAYGSLLANGTIGFEIDEGTYTVTGNSIFLRVLGASCQGVRPLKSNAKAITYSRSGTGLTLNMGTSLVGMQPAPSPTGTGVARIGCFLPDDSFVPNPITPVP